MAVVAVAHEFVIIRPRPRHRLERKTKSESDLEPDPNPEKTTLGNIVGIPQKCKFRKCRSNFQQRDSRDKDGVGR